MPEPSRITSSQTGSFPTTNWTLVEVAQNGSPEESARADADAERVAKEMARADAKTARADADPAELEKPQASLLQPADFGEFRSRRGRSLRGFFLRIFLHYILLALALFNEAIEGGLEVIFIIDIEFFLAAGVE